MTRSLISGNARIGPTLIVPVGYWSTRVLHISFGLPSTSALHEPHLAALQFQRQASVAVLVGLDVMDRRPARPCRQTSAPHRTAIVAAASLSPRNTFSVIFSAMTLLILTYFCRQTTLCQFRRHRRQRARGDVDLVAVLDGDQVLACPSRGSLSG